MDDAVARVCCDGEVRAGSMTRFAAYSPRPHVPVELARLQPSTQPSRMLVSEQGEGGDMQEKAEQDTEVFEITTELQRAGVLQARSAAAFDSDPFAI